MIEIDEHHLQIPNSLIIIMKDNHCILVNISNYESIMKSYCEGYIYSLSHGYKKINTILLSFEIHY